MSKSDKTAAAALATAINAPPPTGKPAPRLMPAAKPKVEKFVALQRHNYLTSSVVEVTLEDGIEVARRQVHPPDIARVALSKALGELERMVEDR